MAKSAGWDTSNPHHQLRVPGFKKNAFKYLNFQLLLIRTSYVGLYGEIRASRLLVNAIKISIES